MSLSETITKGLNNPDCAFYVGQTIGQASTGSLIMKITLIYFGIKLIDKIIFQGIPILYHKITKQNRRKR